jgi:hypothetical protein
MPPREGVRANGAVDKRCVAQSCFRHGLRVKAKGAVDEWDAVSDALSELSFVSLRLTARSVAPQGIDNPL